MPSLLQARFPSKNYVINLEQIFPDKNKKKEGWILK